MVNLDTLSTYQELDTQGMLNHLHAFPEQCRLAWEKVSAFSLPEDFSQVNKLVILGMGGSAIGGDVVSRLVQAESKVPILVHRDEHLPPFVDGNTLVIASSYSGNTRETLSAFKEALKTPAKKLAITAGGELAEIALKEGFPLYRIDYQAPPRAVFPHSFAALLGLMQKLGLTTEKSSEFKKMLQALDKVTKDSAETSLTASNQAKRLATRLLGRIPVIYGAEMLSPVARRWKTQMNENAKTWAFYESFPELNHNAVVGYLCPPQAKEVVHVVLLHSTLFEGEIQSRYQATTRLLSEAGISYGVIEAPGEGSLAQAISLVLFGDYVSFYLAILNKIDPTPIKAIDYLKSYLG